MLRTSSIGMLAFVTAIAMTVSGAQAFDDASYPDLGGGWFGMGGGNHDPSKPSGRGQQAPLTPEYQKILEASLADQASGGQGENPGYRCASHAMPRVMIANVPLQFLIMPETTYVLIERLSQVRRIHTDGRGWPAQLRHSSLGYSIGKWIDEDGDGRFDVLEIETRGFKGPRTFEGSGMPLHDDNQTVIRERIRLDKSDNKLMRLEATITDSSLTQPWSIARVYRREPDAFWDFVDCAENNPHVLVGKEYYMISADGYLMPTKRGQQPPDARYFNTAPGTPPR
jgi:hypothetical protein